MKSRLDPASGFTIRPATRDDIEPIIALDTRMTNVPKPDYWREEFETHGRRSRTNFFLVAIGPGDGLLGFIIGEVRAWEFGSPPCGWVFAIAVDPDQRLEGVGSALFEAVCDGFRKAKVNKVRTMLARSDQLILSFFRSQGMMAGPFTELEKDLDE
ncbi:MAG: GNAT family N-acetyltransferase [Candidatus Velthaea sp.]